MLISEGMVDYFLLKRSPKGEGTEREDMIHTTSFCHSSIV